MQNLKKLIPGIDQRLPIIGLILLAINALILTIGLIAILSIDDKDMQSRFLGVYTIMIVIFMVFNAIIIRIIRRSLMKTTKIEEANIRTTRDHSRSVNQLQVAAEIARDATSQANLQGLLDRAVQLICERFDFYHAGIFLIDEETGYAVIRAAYGVDASQEMLKREHKLKVGEEGIVGFVTGTGQPRVVLDTDADSYHYKNPVLPETCSELTLPFRVGTKIIGALDVQSLKRGAFDQNDVSILQTMADLLAVAIDKANLNEEVQAYADQLEIRVDERTRELESERAQLQIILDSIDDGVIYDEGWKTVYTNSAFVRLTGYTRQENWDEVLNQLKPNNLSDREISSMIQEIYHNIGHEGVWKSDVRLTHPNGTSFDASIVANAVQRNPETNHAPGAVTIIRDISQRKVLEEQKSRFIANAAHELRTPLANMKTRLYLIRHQPEKFEEHYNVMRHVTGRMQRLIDDLLDMSRFERGKIQLAKEPHHLQPIIHDVVVTQRPEAEAKSIRLQEDLSAEPIYAEVDQDRIVQVLTNLISNAINYTQSGNITVRLWVRKEGQVSICIKDTGIGIKPDMIDKIFQPFVRVNHDTTKGTGLGLNISREIIHLHDGELIVESEYGKGSRFTIVLKQTKEQIASV